MTNQSNKFKQLQKLWYSKLANKGFTDIEQLDGNIKKWSSKAYITCKDPEARENRTEYYRLAGQFLWDYKFKNATEKFLWKHHSNGVSLRSIVGLLAKKGIKTNKDALNEMLKKLVKKMKDGATNE